MRNVQSVFEGIVTIKTNLPAVTYDAYAKVHMEQTGNYLRWYGEFEVMGEDKPQIGGPSRVTFSDGRSGGIRVTLDEGGEKGKFQGMDFPPGYVKLPTPAKPVSAEISHTTRHNQPFRRILSNTLFAGSAGLLTAGLWIDGKGWQFAGTALVWMVMAIATSPRRCAHHDGCQPQIEEDNDGHPDE